jgi:Domain of Unknown Function (DUF928)
MRLLTSLQASSIAVLLCAISIAELIPPATALPSQGTLIAASRRRLRFRVGVRPSRHRVGGYSRAALCSNQQMLTALVPPPQSQEGVSDKAATVDKTTAERPTFFVHLPALSPTTAQFTLQNEAGTEQLHSVKFKLTGKPGLVGITLPANAPALKVGQKYVWQVAVACDPEDASNTIVVSSWVERVKTAGSGGAAAADLAEQGIWQDSLALLALQRYQKPSDRAVAEDWAALLEDAGLAQFKQAAIVQMVKN